MAMMKKYVVTVFNTEIVYPNAYFQITHYEGNKNYCDLEVTVFDSKKKEFELQKYYYEASPSFNDNDKNLIKQGYEHLKTLPEYENAVDILEEGQSL